MNGLQTRERRPTGGEYESAYLYTYLPEWIPVRRSRKGGRGQEEIASGMTVT
jgi:hypothetical protein